MTKKKLLIIIASAVLFVGTCVGVCLAVFTKKVEKIDVLKKDMPQVVYVQGSDLNLSSGKLTAVIGDERVEISLNDPEVSVSGYDKNKLGEQVLTITYEEKVTTIKVTVVPRVVVERYESSYFVGEEFNAQKGNLVITNDDGTQFNVDLNQAEVSIDGFSATTEGALTLTATYEKDGVSYSGAFDVAVYDIADVDFKAPNKKEYDNHENGLDVSGGYITLKNADETLIRHIVLTEEMVSGFDLSQATLAHRDTPLEQTLTVEYLGEVKTYDIQINFSDLSLVRLRAEQFKDFEWTEGTTPDGCDSTMGDNALEAMSVYFTMEDSEKNDVEAEELEVLVKTAATYGLDKWKAAFKSYEDAFYLKDGGLYWDCADYEKTKAVYTSLSEKNPVIYQDSLILKQLETNFADMVIVPAEDDDSEDITVGGILSAVYSTEMMDNFAGQLGLMTSLHESLMNVPKDWTLEDLKTTYKTDVEATWVLLRESDYTHIQYRTLYSLATKWREKQDLFDILYTYYYDETVLDDSGKVSLDKINAFKDFHLIGDLETLYTYLYTAKTQIENILNGYAKSDDFMYYYERALKLKNDILTNGSDMEKDLYNRLRFDYLISDGTSYVLHSFDDLFFLFRRTTMGYLYHFNGYLGNPELEGLWSQLVALMEETTRVGESYYETAEFASAVETMFKDYMGLSPMQRVVFMNMLNPYYIPISAPAFPSMAWDDSETTYNNFVFFVYKHYRNVLPESTHEAFRQLMFSVENFSKIGMYSMNAVGAFKDGMAMVADYLDAVAPADKSTFENELNWFYAEYVNLAKVKYQDLQNPKAENLGEWRDDFEELYTAYTEAYFAIEVNKNFQQNQRPLILLTVFAAYEKAEAIANRILNSNNENAIRAFYYDVMTTEMVLPNGMTTPFGGTPDFLLYYIREVYIKYLRSSLFTTNYLLYDYYNDINAENANGMDLKEFLVEASYLYNTFLQWQILGSTEKEPKFYTDISLVKKIMSDFRQLSVDQQHFVMGLDNYQMFMTSIMRFAYEQKMGTDANAAVEQLVKVQYYYTFYQKYPDATDENEEVTYLTLVNNELQILLEDHYEMSKDAAAKELFDFYFGEMYDYYIAKCEQAGLNVTYTPSTESGAAV